MCITTGDTNYIHIGTTKLESGGTRQWWLLEHVVKFNIQVSCVAIKQLPPLWMVGEKTLLMEHRSKGNEVNNYHFLT